MSHPLSRPPAATLGARPVRLVCIDVDGTLVGASGTVHPSVWPAAERLRAAGVRLAVCSGRPGFGDAVDYARRLDPDGWHIFQNGASVVHLGSGASRSAGLPPGAVEALLAQARALDLALELYGDDGYTLHLGSRPADAERAARHAALLGIASAVAPVDALRGAPVRAQWLLAHEDAPRVLDAPPAGLRLVPSYSPVMRDTTFVSVLAPGVDKATAVAAVAAACDVPLDAVAFVGDGGNDAQAMARVRAAGGVAIAMGDAESEAIAVAGHVVGVADEGGLAEALALLG